MSAYSPAVTVCLPRHQRHACVTYSTASRPVGAVSVDYDESSRVVDLDDAVYCSETTIPRMNIALNTCSYCRKQERLTSTHHAHHGVKPLTKFSCTKKPIYLARRYANLQLVRRQICFQYLVRTFRLTRLRPELFSVTKQVIQLHLRKV